MSVTVQQVIEALRAAGCKPVKSGDEWQAQEVRIVHLPEGVKDLSAWPGSSREELLRLIEQAPVFESAPEPEMAAAQEEEPKGKGRGPAQSELLLQIALATCELWHSPGADDSEAYASVSGTEGRRCSWAINSKAFRRWLSAAFFQEHEKVANAQALQDAITTLSGIALHKGEEHTPYIRVAGDGLHDVWLDLCDESWQTLQITADGWRVRPGAESPRFIRRRGMLPLAKPELEGDWQELRDLVNVPDDDDWALVTAWLVGAVHPKGPYPILVVEGEQGSAKSTLCRMLRALIDPNQAALRRPPKEERDCMIAACNSWLVGFDNLSGLPNALSDCLCALATGGGFATRELYSDADEKLFSGARPILCNGIDSPASRPDLLDRSIQIVLPTIPDHMRMQEVELWAQFEAARGRLLGLVCDAVSMALKRRSQITLTTMPRMADFATWATAAEPALPVAEGAFLSAYSRNRESAVDLAIEASPVGTALVQLVQEGEHWAGTATELLVALGEIVGEKSSRRQGWPASPRGLAAALRRLQPELRRRGVEITTTRTERCRQIIIVHADHDANGDGHDANPKPVASLENGPDAIENGDHDANDGHDGSIPTLSNRDLFNGARVYYSPSGEPETAVQRAERYRAEMALTRA